MRVIATLIAEGCRRFVADYFPERQLFLRSRGEVDFVVLSPRMQVISAACLGGFLGWLVFASTSMVIKDNVIAAKDKRLAEMEAAYRSVNNEMSRLERHFATATQEIEDKHVNLASMIDRKLSIENRLAGVSNRLESDAVAVDLAQAGTTGAFPPNPIARHRRGDDLAPSARVLLARANPAPNLAGVNDQLLSVRRSQKDLIVHLQENTRNNVNELETMIQVTGLDIEQLLGDADNPVGAVGGPLIKLADIDNAETGDDLFEDRLLQVAKYLSRLAGLESALQILPLIPPTGHYYVSSKFGKRRDPMTHQWSMHSGIDLSGIRRSPLMAAAPGVVTYASRKGPYGKMVEIDHGQGLKTRYGHMHKIYVKLGERVSFRQEIGQMGSTGRATGPHVHYEIWFDGKPRDPSKFLKAGRYVFRN